MEGFKKCCISTVVEWTGVDIVWNGSEDGGTEHEDGNSDNDW
jgi:hypothetical protein